MNEAADLVGLVASVEELEKVIEGHSSGLCQVPRREARHQAAGLRHLPGTGPVLPRRLRHDRRSEGPQDPRLGCVAAGLRHPYRRLAAQHRLRRGPAGPRQRRGRLRHHRRAVGLQVQVARGREVHFAHAGQFRRGRAARQPEVVELPRPQGPGLPSDRAEQTGEVDLRAGPDRDADRHQLQHRHRPVQRGCPCRP